MKNILAIMTAMSVFSVAGLASAEDVSLHVSGGASEVLYAPWSNPGAVFNNNKFTMGMNGDAKLLFPVIPNLAIGPSTSVFFLPQSKQDEQAAVVWNWGFTTRLQGSRAKASWSPYVDVTAALAKQGNVYDPGMSSTAGVDFALEPTRTLWGGFYLGWNHTFQVNQTDPNDQTLFLDRHSGNIGTAGLSLSFDFPVKQRVVTRTTVQTVQLPPVYTVAVTKEPVVVVAPPVTTPTFVLKQHIMFNVNSSTLDANADTALNAVVTAIKANPGYSVTVEGHASAEGPAQLNLELSKARADAVLVYLLGHGIPSTQLDSVGAGATGQPNDATNRDVDFVVVTLVKK